MNERLKFLRVALGMSMEEFGNKLGVTGADITNLETGQCDLTNQMITSICKRFAVREEWLRTGSGQMTALIEDTGNEQIADFAKSIMESSDSSFRRRFVELLSVLDDADWEALERIFEKWELAIRSELG